MIALLGTVLAMSLVGSPHCAAMCGGFVCVWAGPAGSNEGRRSGWLPHAAYNLGRLLSYAALGAVAGALGAGLDRLGATAGLTRIAAVVAGAMMIVWGGAALLHARGVTPGRFAAPFLRDRISRALRAVHGQPPAVRALVTGLVTTLLPCGFLYAYVTVAAGTGSAAWGALVMATFWLGTVPVMATLGLGAARLLGPFQRRLPAVSAATLMIVGLLTVTGRLQPHAHVHAPPSVSAPNTPPSATPHAHPQHPPGHGDR